MASSQRSSDGSGDSLRLMGVRSRLRAILAATLLSFAAAGVSRAGSVAPPVAPAPPAGDVAAKDALSIYVMTFGPGDHPFFKFGHDAIWIHDAQASTNGTDRVYNFGTFSFNGYLRRM